MDDEFTDSESRNDGSGNGFTPSDADRRRHSTSKGLIARAFSQQLVFRAVGMIATIATVTATTRYLGPSNYGMLTSAIVFVGLWTSLTELGIGSVVVRLVMSRDASLERLVRINIGISLLYSVPLYGIAAVCGVVVYRDSPDIIYLILIISVSLVLMTLSSCFQPVFTATLRFGAVAISDLASKLATLGFTILLVNKQVELYWFAIVQLVAPLIVLTMQGVAASRIVDCRPIVAFREAWQLLRDSFTQTVILTIGFLYFRIDGVILSIVSTPEEVGVYGLAYALAYSVSVVAIFFSSSTLSAMTHLFATDIGRFADFTTRCTEALLFIGMPIAVIGVILSSQIVGAIASTDFVARGGPTLALLIVAATMSFLTGIVSQALFACHDQLVLMKLDMSVLICNIALNLILAPRYGAVAAGIAMIVTECMKMMVTTWRLRSITPYRLPWKFAFALLIPTGISALTAWLMTEFSIFASLPAAVAVYMLVTLKFGPMKYADLRKLMRDQPND